MWVIPSPAVYGSGTFAWSVDVSTLGISGVSTVGDIDGFFFGIGGDETGGGTSYIDDLSITSIPEPATIGMLGFGALVTWVTRRQFRRS
jgi:hypothetical protein